MIQAAEALADIADMEKFSGGGSFIHTLDPRSKIIVTVLFTVTVVSFQKYEITGLLPFFAFPFFLMVSAGIPLWFLLRKLMIVGLFALMVGIANPIIDTDVFTHIGTVPVSGGWISFGTIMLRFALTASAALLLLMTTGMYRLTIGLEKLRIPQVFAVQLFFLCRYLLVLTEETARMLRARDARAFGKSGRTWKVAGGMLSVLFIRSFDRAERIHTAMCCRGFDGTLHTTRKLKWSIKDTLFVVVWMVLFIIFRIKVFEKL